MNTTRPSLLLQIRQPEDALAWSHFDQVYRPLLVAWGEKKHLKLDEAEEVAQAVLTKLITKIREFHYDPQKGGFRAWLRTITQNEIADFCRRRKRDQDRHDRLREGLAHHGAECLPAAREHLGGVGQRRPDSAGEAPEQPEENEQGWEDHCRIHLFREAFRLLREAGDLSEQQARVVELWWLDPEHCPQRAMTELNLKYGKEAQIRSLALKKIREKMEELGEDEPWLYQS